MDPYQLIETEKRREVIIFKHELPRTEYRGGICRFEGLTPTELQQLFEEHLLDTRARQNNSPNIYEFLTFGKKWCDYFVSYGGFIKSVTRPDQGIVVEQICVETEEPTVFSVEFATEFAEMFRRADRFQLTTQKALAWFD